LEKSLKVKLEDIVDPEWEDIKNKNKEVIIERLNRYIWEIELLNKELVIMPIPKYLKDEIKNSININYKYYTFKKYDVIVLYINNFVLNIFKRTLKLNIEPKIKHYIFGKLFGYRIERIIEFCDIWC
jgi:integrase